MTPENVDATGTVESAGDPTSPEPLEAAGTLGTTGTDDAAGTLEASETDERRADGEHGTERAVEKRTVRDAIERVRAVALNEYRLTVRSRWAVALTALFALLAFMLITFSGSAVGPEGFDRIVASLTSLAVYLLPLAALALGYDAIVGPDESGWLDVVFSLPVARAHVVVGTYLGRALVLTGATAIGFGVAAIPLVDAYGFRGWDAYVAFVLGAVVVGLAFLSLAVLVSTVAREKAHALGVALILWVWFVLLHDLIAIGFVAAFDLPDYALSAMILSNPVDAFRVLVLAQLDVGGQSGFAAVLAQTDLTSGLLVVALLAWIVLPLAVAAKLVGRRRL